MTPLEIFLLIILIVLFLGLVVVVWFILVTISFNKLKEEITKSKNNLNTSLVTYYELFIKTIEDCNQKIELDSQVVLEVKSFKRLELDEPIEVKQQFFIDFNNLVKKTTNYLKSNKELMESEFYLNCLKKSNENIEALHATRRVYNANVSYYNQKRITFPHNIVANIKKLKGYKFFETNFEDN